MIQESFSACEQQFPEQRAELRRIFLALRRGGIETMPELCRMYAREPQRILELRSIGGKRFLLIGELCRRYRAAER